MSTILFRPQCGDVPGISYEWLDGAVEKTYEDDQNPELRRKFHNIRKTLQAEVIKILVIVNLHITMTS